MLITLLGTGTPKLDLSRHGPAVLINIDNDLLLFDAGRVKKTQIRIFRFLLVFNQACL